MAEEKRKVAEQVERKQQEQAEHLKEAAAAKRQAALEAKHKADEEQARQVEEETRRTEDMENSVMPNKQLKLRLKQCLMPGNRSRTSLPANPRGLHEMHGNVSEWTCSTYDENYGGNEKQCADESASGRRVLRGGSWNNEPWDVRSANRFRSIQMSASAPSVFVSPRTDFPLIFYPLGCRG